MNVPQGFGTAGFVYGVVQAVQLIDEAGAPNHESYEDLKAFIARAQATALAEYPSIEPYIGADLDEILEKLGRPGRG